MHTRLWVCCVLLPQSAAAPRSRTPQLQPHSASLALIASIDLSDRKFNVFAEGKFSKVFILSATFEMVSFRLTSLAVYCGQWS